MGSLNSGAIAGLEEGLGIKEGDTGALDGADCGADCGAGAAGAGAGLGREDCWAGRGRAAGLLNGLFS